jgi:hypothetical protein
MSESDRSDEFVSVAGSCNTGHLTRILDMAENKGTPVLIKKSAPTNHLPTAAPKTGGGDKK